MNNIRVQFDENYTLSKRRFHWGTDYTGNVTCHEINSESRWLLYEAMSTHPFRQYKYSFSKFIYPTSTDGYLQMSLYFYIFYKPLKAASVEKTLEIIIKVYKCFTD